VGVVIFRTVSFGTALVTTLVTEMGRKRAVDKQAADRRPSKHKRSRWISLTIVLAAGVLAVMMTQPGHTRMKEGAVLDPGRPGRAAKVTASVPNTQNRSHRVGNVWMTITNWGVFGSSFGSGQLVEQEGPYAGQRAPSFEFPAGSGINYLYVGALWFGAIVGNDTLVSVGADGWQAVNEIYPDAGITGEIMQRSSRRSSPHYSEDAISEQDYVAVYTDTLTDQAYVAPDPSSNRRHEPIGLRITQTSYSWSYDYARDFVLIDFVLTNISYRKIEEPYMGLYVDADVWHEAAVTGTGHTDDYSGYLVAVPSPYPGVMDTINIAWTADNDGDPASGGIFDYKSPTGVSGTRVVRGPAASSGCGPAPLNFSFNWWSSNSDIRFDWGPQKSPGDKNFSGGYGTPEGDAQKYRYMSNQEFDYDQLFSAVDYSHLGWLQPVRLARDIADGFDTRYLFSFGPLEDMEPGESTYVTIAYVGGENFHVNPDDFQRHFDPDRPERLYAEFDFSDFAINAQWAAWVFDNPGVDTDGNGCRGLFYLVNCRDTIIGQEDPTPENPYPPTDTTYENCDTVWYTGDGVPDFKGPPPPPSPALEVSAEPGKLTIRWTGEESETAPDNFTFNRDFEGYRVYIAESNALIAYTLIASWDIIDYKRYYFNPSTRKWRQTVDPLRIETLYEMYPKDIFDPRDYPSRSTPYIDEHDSMFYFVPQDWNRSNEYIENGRIVSNPIQYVRTDSLWDEKDKTWRLFGHYECSIDNLLPSQPFYVAVTAFDYGNRDMLAPLESSPLVNATTTYATYSSERTVEERKKVMVYPNPYKISEDYRGRGFEDRDRKGFVERERRIHFVNLPDRATIKIFTLDGDLVRRFDHPDPRYSDTPWHCAWDMITRNTQATVSGIYLYSVESELGTQVGKIVIIK